MRGVDRWEVYGKYSGRCAYCGVVLTLGRSGDTSFQVSHLHPPHLGGADNLDNLVPACHTCKELKETLSVEQFREQLSYLPARLSVQDNYRLAVMHGLLIPTGKTPTFLLDGDFE